MEMHAKRNTSWKRQSYPCTSSRRTDANNVLYNNLYQPHQVYKQRQDESINDIHFDKPHLPIWASIQLNESQKLQEEEPYTARVPIDSRVQMDQHQWNTWVEREFSIPLMCVPNHRRGQAKWKWDNPVTGSPGKIREKDELKERLGESIVKSFRQNLKKKALWWCQHVRQ